MFNWNVYQRYRCKLLLLGSNLGDGGTVGIALALKYTLGFSPAWSSLIINTIVVLSAGSI